MSAPLPPSNFERRQLRNVILKRGTRLHRFYPKDRDPIYFDTSTLGRLNAPDARYGVLYAASAREGAFAETFLRDPGRTLLPADLIDQKAYVCLLVRRDLKFAKLFGNGLAPMGATAEVTHGGLPYDVPQIWSGAFHDHSTGFDGIAYTARHDDEQQCQAVFQRAIDAFEEVERVVDLDVDWFFELLDHYAIGLAPGPSS